MLSKEQPIVVVADQDRVNEAIMRLGRIGLDNVAGHLEHGVQAIDRHAELIGRVRRITAPTVAEQIGAGNPPVVIDIRTQKEWEAGHVEGSVNIPLNELSRRLDEVPADAEVIIHCQGGYRSSLAVSLLQRHGRTNVTDLVGGFAAWKASHLPIAGESDAAACSAGCSV
jgi:rhodanese-related sulfurtransferase